MERDNLESNTNQNKETFKLSDREQEDSVEIGHTVERELIGNLLTPETEEAAKEDPLKLNEQSKARIQALQILDFETSEL